MQRGFIQIPILIAIILGIAALGEGGYIITQKIKSSPKTILTSVPPVSITTEQTPATKITDETKDIGKDEAIISLQKQITDLSKKVSRPKPVEKISSLPVVVEKVANIATTSIPQVITNNFPCSKFSALTEDIYGISIELIDMYLDDGTKENPTKDSFDYPYNKVSTQKTTFYANIERLKQKTDLLGDYEGVSQAKTNLIQTANKFQEAFDLKLQGFKLVNNDAFVYVSGYKILPKDNIDQARLNANQAYGKYSSALELLASGKSELGAIQVRNQCTKI